MSDIDSDSDHETDISDEIEIQPQEKIFGSDDLNDLDDDDEIDDDEIDDIDEIDDDLDDIDKLNINLLNIEEFDESEKILPKLKNKTPKYLFKYEYINIISMRSFEIRNIKNVTPMEAKFLAKQDLMNGLLNYRIKRPLQDNTFDYVELKDLYYKKII